ncbi:hypothetical protein Anas_09872 [Armadillidium nasatum]|uniref:Uncharacterized protein n=1 Tax=Armadillidium nasatum TaxID=96803 RepID=A0A5N5T0C3_9CRUS|nr:hypothetical protein Anas_09872 [Armadillidium nasatum]
MQLRNNNYKPKEEQKILDEIFVLKKSFKSLREFELKQRENKKYREERSRLIEQRNEVFSKVQAIILQEEEIKREINHLRHIIHSSEKSIEHLKTLRPELEFIFTEEQKKKDIFKLKKQKEKFKVKREKSLMKHKERPKKWEEYEVKKEPYEEEKDICKRLLAYLNTTLPTNHCKNDSSETEIEPCVSSVSSLHLLSESPCGSFYSKPKYSSMESTPSKKKKSRDKKKEQKASKKRELSHPPDVISNLSKFSFPIPKTTEDVSSCISLIEKKLKYYDSLCDKNEKLGSLEKIDVVDKACNSNHLPCLDSNKEKCASVSGEEKVDCQNSQLVPPLISINDSLLHASNSSSKDVPNGDSNHIRNSNGLNFGDSKFSSDPNCSTSYFSLPVPLVPDSHHTENSLGPTYASVAAGVKV